MDTPDADAAVPQQEPTQCERDQVFVLSAVTNALFKCPQPQLDRPSFSEAVGTLRTGAVNVKKVFELLQENSGSGWFCGNCSSAKVQLAHQTKLTA